MNPECSSVSERDATFCEAVGYYDAALSSTSSEAPGNQTLRYGIGAANITYVRDSIGLPGSMSHLPFLCILLILSDPNAPGYMQGVIH